MKKIKYISEEKLSPKLKKEIEVLYPAIFENFNSKKFFKKFDYHNNFFLTYAFENEKLIGFKFGFAIDSDLFYSWTGGVHPEYRRKGIAKKLMAIQHDWCKKEKFKIIETRTRNKFPEMIQLNVQSGFQIVGTFTDTDQFPKIILRKLL